MIGAPHGRPIRLLIVDGRSRAPKQWRGVFGGAGDVEIVASVADAGRAVAATVAHEPDVVLVHAILPEGDGIEASRRLLTERPRTRVVMLGSVADHARVLEAIDCGVAGFLESEAGSDELLRAVRAAAAGESPLSPRAGSLLISSRRGRRSSNDLTGREVEVLRLVAGGLRNKQIAARLAISEKTVKAHLTSIFGRLDVTDRTQAALWAQRHGVG